MPYAKLSGPDLNATVEFAHPDIWHREEYPTWSRLVIGARQNEVSLMLELARDLVGPFGILYVLLVSRLGQPAGRYQSPESICGDELSQFMLSQKAFLEQDGRHHIWLTSLAGDGQLIYDNHNMIYAYGDLEQFERRLRRAGFTEGRVNIPSPHGHNYHAEFDRHEEAILRHWNWTMFPLQEDDDP